ncbi:MAG: HD domain-containing protein [Geothermobacteraceae bacterium]
MKQVFVSDIQERDWVEEVFLVREKTTAMARNGKPYMNLKLMDRTGEIEGRIWDRVEEFDGLFERDDFVRVRGRASQYLGKMQLVVQELERLDEGGVDFGDFLPVAEEPREQLETRLRRVVATIEEPFLRALMDDLLGDADFVRAYCNAPAAKSMHHVYLGGLVEHSLSIAGLVDLVCGHYGFLHRDLLLVGALLHDVGKVMELRYSRSFDYTDEGKLLGHIIMGVELIDERIRRIDGFPRELAMHLKHLLLSHHGQYEYGSPKRPKTLEAVALNFLDDLDSKLNGIRGHMEKDAGQAGDWTSYHRLYNRYFFKGSLPGVADGENREATESRETPKAKPVPEKKPSRRSDRPLSFSLGEQLAGRNLDLFPREDDES